MNDKPETPKTQQQPKSLIPASWAVPTKFRARVGEAAGRQRQMVDDGHLLLVLHEVPKAGDSERKGRFFWRDKQGAWRSSSHGSGVGGLREHLAEFEGAVDALEEKLRMAASATDFFAVLQGATPLHRTSRNLLRTLQEAREAVDDRELINLRDRANEVERGAELLVSEARDGLDFTSARQAEQQAAVSLELARDSHRLNVITAVFLPMTALASVFSMTLHSGLEGVGEPWLFWLIVAAGGALGFAMRGGLARGTARGS